MGSHQAQEAQLNGNVAAWSSAPYVRFMRFSGPAVPPPAPARAQERIQSELVKELGPAMLELDPQLAGITGGKILSFYGGEHGDGLVLLRSAQWDNDLLGQWRAIRTFLDHRHLSPRTILASGGLSGTSSLDRRLDLLMVHASIAGDWCRWLACSDSSRISRNPELY